MKITKTEVFVLGDHAGAPKDGATVHGLAFVRIHTDSGLTGVSEIFVVPPGVARAVLDGPESLFGRLLIGEDPCPPQRLWTRLYNSMLHGNRRGWVIICLGAVDVALWDLYGKAMDRPVWQLLGGNERARYQVVEGTDPSHVTPYCTIISD
ncbi:MAG: mandelate racemase/muconate lactonizing enzyme family protein, partial [Candidatus Latescibacterota bacterium]|nr:mandelate racemase/muconate lactonizing enzyme family protein [Candidatus Latescibacterota bacterium]